MLIDKQTYSKNHHHQKMFCQEDDLNQTFEVSRFYPVLL